MRSKKITFEHLVPLGLDGRKTCLGIVTAVFSSWVFSIVSFLGRYYGAHSNLFDPWNMYLRPGVVMQPFFQIWDSTSFLFALTAFCMLPLALWHYYYHFRDSRSIYLMRRLPDRWDLWRRCLALPLLGLTACFVLVVLNTLLFYAVYCFFTPRQCLEPGQWRMFWENLFSVSVGGLYYA
ncbi:MAG: hypothetical protein K2O18_04150 [Oscillospiraceae bacterium]|nr:hypothetical protein [Oscillospiraceae bacterium]